MLDILQCHSSGWSTIKRGRFMMTSWSLCNHERETVCSSFHPFTLAPQGDVQISCGWCAPLASFWLKWLLLTRILPFSRCSYGRICSAIHDKRSNARFFCFQWWFLFWPFFSIFISSAKCNAKWGWTMWALFGFIGGVCITSVSLTVTLSVFNSWPMFFTLANNSSLCFTDGGNCTGQGC